jgi:hypothetical protein
VSIHLLATAFTQTTRKLFLRVDEARHSPARIKPGAKILTAKAYKVLLNLPCPTRNKQVANQSATRQPNSYRRTERSSKPASNLHRIHHGQKLSLEATHETI